MRNSVLALVIMTWSGVSSANTPISEADRVFFEKKVRPLLANRCYKCHSTGAKKRRGGLLLDSRAAILRGGDSGPALVPGKPERSLLLQAVGHRSPDLQMPPRGKLPATEIALFHEWIRRGAPFPGPIAQGDSQRTIDIQKGKQFWSFLPLRSVPVPRTRQSRWTRTSLDAFILARLEKQHLAPAPQASKRALIRRAYFDLVGLPPSPEEVSAFLHNSAPDAYERLIDRLLASPLHGERWARYWLDLARYCDVPESWVKRQAPAHRYRDWVVQAFNEDLPYDQFVQNQLAADLLPGVEPRHRAALGFLGLSPDYWKELKLDHNVIKAVVAEEWEERIDAVSRTFLGLTVSCARCHDHKFDPITQQDYYALAGVFASIRQADRLLLPSAVAERVQRARERVKGLQGQVSKLRANKPISAKAARTITALEEQIEQIRKKMPHIHAPLAVGVEEASLHVLPAGPHRTRLVYRPGEPQDVALQIRGSPTNLGPVVPRRFLQVLSEDEPQPFRQGSGRGELAQAMTTDAAPLLARVMVNRVWKHHFGKGLIETPSNLGAQGERPSHPALLEHLAFRFVQRGWSLKWLHREIMLSATYRQDSKADENKRSADPGNRLLSRMNRRKLDIEAWRDAMLAVAGTLRLQVGGPPLDLGDANNTRRTLYGRIKRRDLHTVLRLHDVPDATVHSPTRVPTTTPLQQLYVLNSPFIQRQASALAHRVQHEAPHIIDTRIQRAYRLLFARSATPRELTLARQFLSKGTPSAWEQYTQVLLGSNEFLFID